MEQWKRVAELTKYQEIKRQTMVHQTLHIKLKTERRTLPKIMLVPNLEFSNFFDWCKKTQNWEWKRQMCQRAYVGRPCYTYGVSAVLLMASTNRFKVSFGDDTVEEKIPGLYLQHFG